MARSKQAAKYALKPSSTRQIQRQAPNTNKSRSYSEESNKEKAQINANQFSIKFDNQQQCESKAIPLKVIQCKKCGAFLNSKSAIANKGSNKLSQQIAASDVEKQFIESSQVKQWQCQFCLNINVLPFDFQNLPQENQCYLLEEQQENKIHEENKENILIYCIDISQSMDQKFRNKSRISAVKEAIRDQIKRMKFQNENIQVGIIAFGSLVTLFHGKQNQHIPKEYNDSFQALIQYSKKVTNFFFSINNNFQQLLDFIEGLSTYGSTALGPALVASIELASRGRKGSKIIVCTDGEANIGLKGSQFYSRTAEYAKKNGVVVNILSIKGDRCNLKELGKLTLSTGGSILKIDPDLLGSQFNKIAKEEVLGSESKLKIIVNPLFQIQHRNGQLSKDKTILRQNYGSFTKQTQLAFNFKLLTNEQAATKGINYDDFLKRRALLPMQIQLSYITPSGQRYLQVITDYRQLSQEKNDILNAINFGLYSAGTLQKVSGLIKEEKYLQAQVQIKNFDYYLDQHFANKQDKKEVQKFKDRIRILDKVGKSKKSKKEKNDRRQVREKQSSKDKYQRKQKKEKKHIKKEKESRQKVKSKRSYYSDSDSDSSSQIDKISEIASDSEEEVLYREMRARSRSRSLD